MFFMEQISEKELEIQLKRAEFLALEEGNDNLMIRFEGSNILFTMNNILKDVKNKNNRGLLRNLFFDTMKFEIKIY